MKLIIILLLTYGRVKDIYINLSYANPLKFIYMKNFAIIICIVLFSGCSIQGRYYLYDTTDPDIDIPVMMVLSDNKRGVLANSNSRLLGSDFHYETERLFEKYKVINIEYCDTTKFHLSNRGLVWGNVIMLKDGNDSSQSYDFVKVESHYMKTRSPKKQDRYAKIPEEKFVIR